MSKAKSGGGISSNKLVNPGVKSGSPTANKINPGGAAQLGSSTIQNPTPLVKGTMNQVPLGNAVAPSTVCGPGGSRSVSKPGSQGTH
jgi:hypothetical protein